MENEEGYSEEDYSSSMLENAPKKKPKSEDLIIEAKNFFNFNKEDLGESIRKRTNVVFLDFMKLTEFSNKLSDEIIINPEETLSLIEQGVEELGLVKNVRIRLKNLSDAHQIKIRNIRSKHLNELIILEGIIRQASDVRPQVVNAKFECPSCGTVISVLQIEKKFREPSRCSCGRRGGFRLISKDMVDTQRLVVEEPPESLSGGEQPKRINVFVKEDLVEPKMEDKTTPGARIKIIGILKEVPVPLSTGGLSTRFELAVEANNIIPMEETFEELDITDEDERQIQELSEDPKIFETLAKSITPSVWGYDEIKKALVLQLFGGVQKQMSDGSKSRGDIHILLIGDPGVAKSVTLVFMSNISPKGRYVVGKSTSGAGLTATVVRDEYLKGWSLEAGAMVLANKGLICIDELEKMDPQDRSAMHEAMEQQTVTISKANVQATLKAQTSVLAAANPKFGRFDPFMPIPQQIDLPPTLINRFDIIFTLRDIPDRNKDERIATHVLKEHQKETKEVLIDSNLFRKYVAYAKQKINPKLIPESVEELKKFYIELRNKPVTSESAMRPIPISARQLQALIRMSEASARMRLSEEVSKDDAKKAIELMTYYLTQVGYDYESKTFDIDKISGKFSSSQRNKILMVKEAITALESKMGKMIPYEEIEKELEEKISKDELEEVINRLIRDNEIYRPKKGYIGVF
ncbi:MAG TPA: minichromosome maintenance protein MCM [Candidatus Pacearchaeota archaeon]|nr:minichromosome maintenance protein MCM [Candidatus Pacearchaeota archaeon]